MEQNTHLSNVMDTIRHPKLDEACKRILSFKIILAHILKACLEEFKNIDVNDIAEKYIEGKPLVSKESVHQDEGQKITGRNTEDNTVNEGLAKYDILFDVYFPETDNRIKMIINVEGQSIIKSLKNLLRRTRYYCARMISQQYGREFKKAEYEKINKVVSIWILFDPNAQMRNTIKRIHLTETDLVGSSPSLKEYYDTDEVILVCLGNEDDDNYSGLIKMLDVLFSEKIDVDTKKQMLEKEYGIKMTEEMEEEVLGMCDYSVGVYERGLAQGIAQGVESNLLENIKSVMKNLSISLERALEILNVPQSEYEKYKKLIN